MDCTLEFLTKSGRKNDRNFYRGVLKCHNGVAEFVGSRFQQSKPNKYILEEVNLLKITNHDMRVMVLSGKMDGKRCQWRIRI